MEQLNSTFEDGDITIPVQSTPDAVTADNSGEGQRYVAEQEEPLTMEDIPQRIAVIENRIQKMGEALTDRERRLSEQELTSYDGTLLFKIDDVMRRRQEAASGQTPSICSPAFHTCRYGYKVAVRVYLDGNAEAKGSHISLKFIVLKGEYDAILPWPFKPKVTLMMLNQNSGAHRIDAIRPNPTSPSFRRPESDTRDIASGVALFCPLTDVFGPNSDYIKNNTMYIKIVVEPEEEE